MTPAISVVMPTRDRAPLLQRVLAGYEAQAGELPFELVVADDGSRDETSRLLASYPERRFRLRTVTLAEGRGPGQARNAALARAEAPLVLIVGDDILPSPGFVARHVAAQAERPATCWAVLGRTCWPDDLPVNRLMRHIDGIGAQQFSYAHLRDGQELDFRHFYTSNVSLPRALLERVTPWFDPDFVHAAYEDAELAYRLSRQAGLRIHYDASALATHYHPYDTPGFARRQYKCGLMASVFLRKHPELRGAWAMERIARLAAIANEPRLAALLDPLSADDEAEAERVALSLGSAGETLQGRIIDWVYVVLFEYFVLKGMIEGELGGESVRPRRALLAFGLLYRLNAAIRSPLGRALAETPAAAALGPLAERFARQSRDLPLLRRWRWLLPVRRMLLPRY